MIATDPIAIATAIAVAGLGTLVLASTRGLAMPAAERLSRLGVPGLGYGPILACALLVSGVATLGLSGLVAATGAILAAAALLRGVIALSDARLPHASLEVVAALADHAPRSGGWDASELVTALAHVEHPDLVPLACELRAAARVGSIELAAALDKSDLATLRGAGRVIAQRERGLDIGPVLQSYERALREDLETDAKVAGALYPGLGQLAACCVIPGPFALGVSWVLDVDLLAIGPIPSALLTLSVALQLLIAGLSVFLALRARRLRRRS